MAKHQTNTLQRLVLLLSTNKTGQFSDSKHIFLNKFNSFLYVFLLELLTFDKFDYWNFPNMSNVLDYILELNPKPKHLTFEQRKHKSIRFTCWIKISLFSFISILIGTVGYRSKTSFSNGIRRDSSLFSSVTSISLSES